MKRTFFTQQWSQRRTQALLGRLKAQAPLDFRAQVMARVYRRPDPVAPTLPHPAPRHYGRFYPWQREARLLQSRHSLLPTAAMLVGVVFLGSALFWRPLGQRHGGMTHPGHETPVQNVLSLAVPDFQLPPHITGEVEMQGQLYPTLAPPTTPDDPLPVFKTETQRLQAKRLTPVKPKRAKKGQGAGKQAAV